MTASVPGPDGKAAPAAQHYAAPLYEPDAPAGYVAPGMPGAPAPYAYAPLPAAAPRTPNAGAALAAALGAVVVGALAYGFLMKALDREFGWLVIGLAAAVAWPLGKLGGRNPVLPVAGAVLAALSLLLGQFFGVGLYLHQLTGASLGELYGPEFSVTLEGWKAVLEPMDALFYGIALFEGFVFTRRISA
ncbi:hypothetical protein OG689_24700 [Kitasatospora sp. NBC_00240]|uniref:hypothetical protein n=1 Tax=Kitasatospora sp. NBC_00240 TaxID=2903567 RepID=UPI0022585F72|nr:hypothetical protein [Kitasatospora sp. NBC_00240]MCX5212445.1 hypothetical protein [Kitasatospora sp. NBC_00240]